MNVHKNSDIDGGKIKTPTTYDGSDEFENFIYLLSHDVRNSVRALLEVPQWIQEDLIAEGYSIDGPLAENFELMNIHTRRLDRMLIDLLVYSRVGRRQALQSVNLDEAIELVLDQMALPRGFNVVSDIDHKVIRMGERDILTLLSELISNSFKHHHLESGIIRILSRRDGDECVICICDDGPGIPQKYRERVFGAMTTLKPRDEVEGSGMGLTTVRKIVDFYDGSLRWQMKTDECSTNLEVRFPI